MLQNKNYRALIVDDNPIIKRKRGRPKKNSIYSSKVRTMQPVLITDDTLFEFICDDIIINDSELIKNNIDVITHHIDTEQPIILYFPILETDIWIDNDSKNQMGETEFSDTMSYYSVEQDEIIEEIKPEIKPEIEIKKEIKCKLCANIITSHSAYIAETYKNKIYTVIDDFCCFECALSYNMKNMNDSRCGIRHALTLKLRNLLVPDYIENSKSIVKSDIFALHCDLIKVIKK